MSYSFEGECSCDCHSNVFEVMHIMPCCDICPVCHKKIRYGYDKHVKSCKDSREKLLEEYKKYMEEKDSNGNT